MTVMITGGEDLDHEEARDTRDTGPGGEDSPKSPLIPWAPAEDNSHHASWVSSEKERVGRLTDIMQSVCKQLIEHWEVTFMGR